MSLGHAVAHEQHVRPDQVLLLRHSNSKVKSLLAAGGKVSEYTSVQPTDSIYDFLATGRPDIEVIAVIVNDHLHGVFRVDGVEKVGTTRTLVSQAFRDWDAALGYPERPARRFLLAELPSKYKGRAVVGWSSPRHPVARYGHRMFDNAAAG